MTTGRYLMVLGPRHKADVDLNVALSHNLVCDFDWADIKIWRAPQMPMMELPAGRGVILGHIFRRSDFSALNELTGVEATAFFEKGEEWLIGACFGSYVACVRPATHAPWTILRDPSGNLACYYVAGRLSAFASEAKLLVDTGLYRPEIDWDRMVSHLAIPSFREMPTMLIGLNELSPGHSIKADTGRTKTLWSPWNFITPKAWISSSRLASELRETVEKTVKAWANAFDQILLGASGGLDSSIIAACLAHTGTATHCLNLATSQGDGDERYFARRITGNFGLPLSECFFDLAHIDISRSPSAHLARPAGKYFMQSWLAHANATMPANKQGAIFSGNGGDNVFCYTQSATPLVDRYRCEGLGQGAWDTLKDISEANGAGIGTVFAAAWKKARATRDTYFLKPDARFLVASRDIDQPAHPWLDAPAGTLPGKAAHVGALMRIQSHLEPFEMGATVPFVTPLLAQPIVELCLSIESWRWCEGGTNRRVARDAFTGRLPREIVQRVTKGGPDAFSLEIFDAKQEQIRAQIMDGVLIDRAIVDGTAIDQFLSGERKPDLPDILRILAIANAEAWISSWKG